MSGKLMTPTDKIIVKRQYLVPIPEDKELEKVGPNTMKYKHLMRSRKCTICPNVATQLFCRDIDGAIFKVKYCDNCIKEEKHIKPSELMENFDNLFIQAEVGSSIYEELHAKTPKYLRL